MGASNLQGANVIGRREASETKHREPGNVEKIKYGQQKKKKKEEKEEGEKIYCTENILHTYVYINSFLIPVRPITFAGVA